MPTPTKPPDGVIYSPGPLPPVAPGPIASRLKSIVHESLGQLPPGAGGAKVEVTSDAGVNLVVAHRGANGRWETSLWIGKSWGKDPATFGASAAVIW